ncbi:hypothetical protein ONZ45_g3432 [Pleurotus djamor]|nr:hypothetical protein ONZ45_g3432 [Pleurotus djamor]
MIDVKEWIHEVVALRCSKLPIRLYDTYAEGFITRSQLCILQLQRHLKRLILYHTRYAILSHTWGRSELDYQSIRNGSKSLFHDPKFAGFYQAAMSFGCRYIWLDTACIDKSSSSELDESIRSMFTWYRMAYLCVVHLEAQEGIESVDPHSSDPAWTHDRWFQRGWTLQELLAPKRMVFLGKHWQRLCYPTALTRGSTPGTLQIFDVVRKFGLENHDVFEPEIDLEEYDEEDISFFASPLKAIGISHEDLAAYKPSPKNARTIFTYMSQRKTTIPEDTAYCLLGLLGIVLPTAYGEGQEHALYRLQVACAERTNERNIFFWDCAKTQPSQFNSMLPRNPFTTEHLSHKLPCAPGSSKTVSVTATELWSPLLGFYDVDNRIDPSFTFTNAGLRIAVILHNINPQGEVLVSGKATRVLLRGNRSDRKLAILGTYAYKQRLGSGPRTGVLAVILEPVMGTRTRQYLRVPCTVDPQALPPIKDFLDRDPEIIYIV